MTYWTKSTINFDDKVDRTHSAKLIVQIYGEHSI